MYRLVSILVAILYLTAEGAGEPAEPDCHVWRGEYARALEAAARVPNEDRAAYLTMAGHVAEASRVLASLRDPFRAGVIAFKAEHYEEALDALAAPVANRYLEGYRRFIRGASLHRLGRGRVAEAEFDTLFSLVETHRELADHPLIEQAANIYAELLAREVADSARAVVKPHHAEVLSGRSRFLLSLALIDVGSLEQGERWFFSGLEAPYDTGAIVPFEGALRRLGARFHTYDKRQSIAIAEYAVRRAKSTVAEHIMTRLAAAFPNDYDVRFLKARYEAGIGKVKRAVSLSRELFESRAPVALKKKALLQAASLEYRLKRYGRAADSYRLFGMYYPTDARSVKALDLAARIEVARGRWSRALSVWRTLRHRGPRTKRAQQAALSEAVLRFMRGSKREAYRILEELLPRVDEAMAPAVLYWLHRTAGTDDAAGAWRDRLQRDHPQSFYAAVAGGDGGCTHVHPGEPPLADAGCTLTAMEWRERAIFETVQVDLPPSDPLRTHPAYEAYGYFRSCGMLDEASNCAMTLVKRFGRDRDRMVALYRDARSHGMIDFALRIANTPALFPQDLGLPTALRYPICFTGTISEHASERGVPATLVLAVIREESRFNPTATSRAGAIGLMQLMPATGKWLAAKIGAHDHSGENLLEPAFSIAAGTWYLHYLLNRYDGSTVTALAAYNAGHAHITSWIRQFEPARHPMIALEMIGIGETREYVKRVLDTMAAYRHIYAARNSDES